MIRIFHFLVAFLQSVRAALNGVSSSCLGSLRSLCHYCVSVCACGIPACCGSGDRGDCYHGDCYHGDCDHGDRGFRSHLFPSVCQLKRNKGNIEQMHK